MTKSYVKIILMTNILLLIFTKTEFIVAQNDKIQDYTRSILIVNKKGQTFKRIEEGDPIRIILKDRKKIKGYINSINNIYFSVDTTMVFVEKVKSVSTKRKQTQIIAGSLLLGGAVASFALSNPCLFGSCSGFRESGFLPMFGLALTVGAVASFLPNYHKIAKNFKW